MPYDFITDFFRWTADEWSPEIFRRWAGITSLAAALERRVWIRTGKFITFPNLYTLFVAAPGTGKQVISSVRKLLMETVEPGTEFKSFRLADESVTRASLIDALFESKKTLRGPNGEFAYSALFVTAEEFSLLLPSNDMDFIGALNGIYDNKPSHTERRRHGRPPRIEIEFPVLNLLGGIQPVIMATFPEEVWTSGLGRRAIMVFSAEQKIRNPFVVTPQSEDIYSRMGKRLGEISQIQGEISWTDEAMTAMVDWWMAGGLPIPSHSKLTSYCQNRAMNIMKLAGISVISRGIGMTIELLDFHRALGWMLEVEKVMPDVFLAMKGRSDQVVIEELHRWMVGKFIQTEFKPIHKSLVWAFLADRIPGEKTKAVFELAINTGAMGLAQGSSDSLVPSGDFRVELG